MNPGEVLRELGPRGIVAWQAWLDMEPRGDERADQHAALIVKEIVNTAATGDERIGLIDVLDHLRDHWIDSEKERQRRKETRKIRRRKKQVKQFQQYTAAELEALKNGRKFRKNDSRNGA